MTASAIAIIVPTHNRRGPLVRLLDALARQQPVDGGFRVVVVADGCSDDTAATIADGRWPFPVVVIEQPSLGPAEARNRGAAHADAELLLFLDDDVEPEPDLVRAHVSFHAALPNAIAVGDLPPVVRAGGLFGTTLRGWWDSAYDGSRQVGHRHTYRDLLSGHFSIPRGTFDALGGFERALRCHEDYELGFRAIEQGVALRFLPGAVARHHEVTELPKTLRRKFDEGIADVQLLAMHPHIAPMLPCSRMRTPGRLGRMLTALAWRHPRIGDAVARRLQAPLVMYDRVNLRFRWRALLEDLLDYWYCRGLAQACGGRREHLRALLAQAPPLAEPELVVDLAGGIDDAKARIDEVRPGSVRLVFGDDLVGDVLAEPGAEPLRGVHLPRIIARQLSDQYLGVARRAGVIPRTLPDPPLVAIVRSSDRGAAPIDSAEALAV